MILMLINENKKMIRKAVQFATSKLNIKMDLLTEKKKQMVPATKESWQIRQKAQKKHSVRAALNYQRNLLIIVRRKIR